MAFDDKGDNDWNSNDTDDDPQSDTPHRQVKGSARNRQARHGCSSIRAAGADSGQIDSFFDVISISNRSSININGINSGRQSPIGVPGTSLPQQRQNERQQDAD
ncbi:MAG TPA: hypothetical protein VKB36_03865, partial [Vicinamibacterales bacterium]|nr:hypothetical protein [Vicinamibacterales bacterium]